MLIRVELGRWTLHLELGRTDPDPTEPAPDTAPYPMQVYAPEYVGFLPPNLEPHEYDERATQTRR